MTGLALLALRLSQLQLWEGARYRDMARRNALDVEQIPPRRGRILDRRGALLADSELVFDLLELPGSDGLPVALRRLGIPRLRGLSREEIARVEAHRRELPPFRVLVRSRRVYPQGRVAAHLLGTLRWDGDRQRGTSGLEARYDPWLRGRQGLLKRMVDARGRQVQPLWERRPRAGCDLYLTVDLRLQRVAERLLAGKRGAIVAMDPRSGQVLALASSPGFDPNALSRGISASGWRRLINDRGGPLLNRAIAGLYPPGSCLKPLIALAALQEGVISPSRRVRCTGRHRVGDRYFSCWRAHGWLDLGGALVQSCDVYFYRLGQRLGMSRMISWLRHFGLGQRTGIDLPGERAGYLPHPEAHHWLGERCLLAIGQGRIGVTPLQMAVAMSAIANGGIVYTPFLVREIRGADGNALRQFVARARWRVPVRARWLALLRRWLWQAVNSPKGTGRKAALRGLRVAGKTGTAEAPGGAAHAWFVGFAPANDPRICVAVVVERGGSGGRTAAPLARQLFATWLRG